MLQEIHVTFITHWSWYYFLIFILSAAIQLVTQTVPAEFLCVVLMIGTGLVSAHKISKDRITCNMTLTLPLIFKIQSLVTPWYIIIISVSLPTSCSYQLNQPCSSWSLLSPGGTNREDGGPSSDKQWNVPCFMTRELKRYVRLDVRLAAACGRRGRTSSRAPRCWREEAGWLLPRKCGRLSHDGSPRCRVTGGG